MRSTSTFWFCVVLYLACCGCSGPDYDGPQRFAVSGEVTVGSEPLEPGLIGFYPIAEGNNAGRVAGGPIREGKYSIPEEQGPNAGKYRVEIHWNKPTGREVKDGYGDIIPELVEGLPAKYHADSELTADVAPDQTTFDFDLSSN